MKCEPLQRNCSWPATTLCAVRSELRCWSFMISRSAAPEWAGEHLQPTGRHTCRLPQFSTSHAVMQQAQGAMTTAMMDHRPGESRLLELESMHLAHALEEPVACTSPAHETYMCAANAMRGHWQLLFATGCQGSIVLCTVEPQHGADAHSSPLLKPTQQHACHT